MPEESLKDKLINKIKEIDDPAILEEVSNLFELQEPETIYQVNSSQQKAIEEAREQIKNNTKTTTILLQIYRWRHGVKEIWTLFFRQSQCRGDEQNTALKL